LTHNYFTEESAQVLWEEMVIHKKAIEKTLGRKVGISVAALEEALNKKEPFACDLQRRAAEIVRQCRY